MIHAHQFCPDLGDALGPLNFAVLFCRCEWSPGNKSLSIDGSNLLRYLCVHECPINSNLSKDPIPKGVNKASIFPGGKNVPMKAGAPPFLQDALDLLRQFFFEVCPDLARCPVVIFHDPKDAQIEGLAQMSGACG
jgi:hypothetical protein